MRLLWWCAVAAVLAAAEAGTLRRTSTTELPSRSARRFIPPAVSEPTELDRTDSSSSAIDLSRPHSFSRRRDGPVEKDFTRFRSRKDPQKDRVEKVVQTFTERKPSQSEGPTSYIENNHKDINVSARNRYSSRIRKKPDESSEEVASDKIKPVERSTRIPIRTRTRQHGRPAPTPATVEVSSPFLDEKRTEIMNTNLDKVSQVTVKADSGENIKITERPPSRTRQRSRFTTSDPSTENAATKRSRGRISTNSRSTTPKSEASDTASSESNVDITVVFKEPTTARTADSRSSRKLRYKTRLSETDTNLTGNGIVADDDIKSSQDNISITNQTDRPKSNVRMTFRSKITRKPGELDLSSGMKSSSRGRGSARPPAVSTKQSKSSSGEISDDDNYPESFKALLQAKNVSQQADTHKNEGLSVKASQKVYNTYTPTASDTRSSNAQRYTRFRPSQSSMEASKRIDSLEEKEMVDNASIKKSYKESNFKNRTSYLAKYRKSIPLPTSSTEAAIIANRNKYNISSLKKPNDTVMTDQNKNSQYERSKTILKKPSLRQTYYSRLRVSTNKPETVSKIDVANDNHDLNIELRDNERNLNGEEELEEVPEPQLLTAKYHSSYKDSRSTTGAPYQEYVLTSAPPIKNIHSRHSLAKARTFRTEQPVSEMQDPDEDYEDMPSRKYIESYSKTTMPTTNMIPELDKSKGKFSSKYRAPFDRPMYIPTVPSVTSSTEEGQENEIGQEVNIISFNKVPSTPSSADLTLSETVLMPSHLINVETSIHSPSATISIFDALAEILTSTPKALPSPTSDVKAIPENKSIINITLDDVSNKLNTNLNVPQGSASENTLSTTSFDETTITKPVQTTIQPTINMINDLSLGTSAATPSSVKSTNILTDSLVINPSPVPTSPLPMTSRKPFATILLYSTTKLPSTDAFITSPSTSNLPSTTESSSTVFNTVSDLILSNNNVISSQLTSMLSDNIRDILVNMDDATRKRVIVNMDSIFKSLSLGANDTTPLNINELESTPNTTPFSEDDISATQVNVTFSETNVDINKDIGVSEVNKLKVPIPIVFRESANSTVNLTNLDYSIIATTTVESLSITSVNISLNTQETSTTSTSNNAVIPTLPSAPSNIVNIRDISPPTNPLPIPFISNLASSDDIVETDITSTAAPEQVSTKPLTMQRTYTSSLYAPLTLRPTMQNINIQDPYQLTPAEFWRLSKKARVLKIIEDIIRQNNIELTSTPSSSYSISDVTMNLINGQYNIGILNLNNGSSTSGSILSAEINTQDKLVTTDSSSIPFISSKDIVTDSKPILDFDSPNTDETTADMSTDSPNVRMLGVTLPSMTPTTPDTAKNMTNSLPETSISVDATTSIFLKSPNSGMPTEIIPESTTALPSFSTIENQTDIKISIPPDQFSTTSDALVTTLVPTTTLAPLPTTTITMEATTIEPSLDSSTEAPTTDPYNMETTTETAETVTTDSEDVKTTTTTTKVPVGTPMTIFSKYVTPKKDYVIFGILPNNTVVRKNPNDDPLETLTEASPYIVYGVLPDNTIIRKFPNGTRVPRVMQQIDVLPISPWSLRNPYSPIHNNPAIVKPFNPIQQSVVAMHPSNSTPSNEMEITGISVNNTPPMISSQALNVHGKRTSSSSKLLSGIKAAGPSTLSHVLSLRTSTMLPSIDEILLNSLSSATKEEHVFNIPAMTLTTSTMETRILTLDIDPETQMIRTEKPNNGMGSAVFKYIPINEIKVQPKETNVQKLSSTRSSTAADTIVSTVKSDIIDTSNMEPSTTVTITTTTTTGTPATTPFIFVGTTPRATTTASSATTLPSTTLASITESITSPTTILPTMISPKRMQFRTTTESMITTNTPYVLTTTTQRRRPSENNDEIRISTTSRPLFTSRTRPPVTTVDSIERTTMRSISEIVTTGLPTGRRKPANGFRISTTDMPITSTFSIQDDIAFLQSLKNVVNSNPEDPESSLANRIIALAVERSLNDLNTNKEPLRSGKKIDAFGVTSNRIQAKTTTTSTTSTTTTTPRPTTTVRLTTTAKSTPSIEEDIRQFQEDTKLLQALLKATGQNPANFKLPTITTAKSNVRSSPNKLSNVVDDDLKLLGNLLSSPSPLNEPFDSLTPRPNTVTLQDNKAENSISLNVKPLRTGKPNNVRNSNAITPSIQDDLKSFQDDTKLLQTLLQLQGEKVTTTPKNKVSITGLTGDETLATLLAQSNKKAAVAATKAPLALSTEYGKTNDALLAALLKEQGFGPTTANSAEEQIKLAALLNQVVVTPKSRRVPPPPPPPPPAPARRPIIDGLAWLWQQWQETEPGPGGTRGARRPAPAARPAATAAASTPPRVSWFGSGPFVGNADDDQPASSNRIPLEPPGAGAADPGRGQLVSAAINVTRAFSQFLGAAIQGAAKTVQNVIQAGRKAASDVYASGSG